MNHDRWSTCTCPILNIFIRSIEVWSCPNQAKFCMLLAPQIFWGWPPKCMDPIFTFSLVQTMVKNLWQSANEAQRYHGKTKKIKKKQQQNISPLWKLSLPDRLINLGQWWSYSGLQSQYYHIIDKDANLSQQSHFSRICTQTVNF